MDMARELLNNLMGRDRNKPKGDTTGRDHYSNRDVRYYRIPRSASHIWSASASTPYFLTLCTMRAHATGDMTLT